jgi:uncharacterized protein
MRKTKLIVNLTRGECICVSELADGPLLRMRGLIGRRGLPAGEGLLLSPAPGIHTAFMRFPIDALFLDRDLRVLDVVERLRPWRVAANHGARAVLELAAGECARRKVEVGDRLELRDRKVAGVVRAAAQDVADAYTSEPGIGATAQVHLGERSRIQPLRVVVVSADRHFGTVMSLLLARRNCSVITTANASRVAELVARESAEVVLIDSDHEAGAAAVATVHRLARPVGVVLVADEARTPVDAPPVLPKWGPFEDLLAAIEEADTHRQTGGDDHDRG